MRENHQFCFKVLQSEYFFSLEAQAQEYAELLAEKDESRLNHCQLPDCDRHGAGENLLAVRNSITAEINATKAW